MEYIKKFWVISLVVTAGYLLRLFVATQGFNFDYESYIIVIEIVNKGKNVYAETSRYNYGPIWAYILKILYLIAGNKEEIFRYVLAGFLSFIDLGIFIYIWNKFNKAAATLFFLNPISIIITGYHNQFDNLAILLAMIAVTTYGDDFKNPINQRKWLGLFILGLSLSVKHIFFAFPLWLAIKQKSLRYKILVVAIPVLIFLMGFIPFLSLGKAGIFQNVFNYLSWNNAIFYNLFILENLKINFSSRMVWLIILGISAYVFRKENGLQSLMIYSAIMVAASPGIANQYLAIVIPYLSVHFNFMTILYTLVGTWYLAIDKSGLAIKPLQSLMDIARNDYYSVLIMIIVIAIIWNQCKDNIKQGIYSLADEVKSQLEW
ncbi:MAG: hypothetical protein MUP85_06335 [Candidatus Lokiarchaeota archaeon]|nr:hypothetical protein [Candidatus Lokiarchaeota archaeon]